jgi:hypothetical protein
MTRETHLSSAQLALVLRRAAELERRRRAEAAPETGATVSEGELREIVDEVGLPQADVQRALGELRAGILPGTEDRASLLDRLVGPAELASERIVDGDVATIERRVSDFLRSQAFEVKRDFGDRVRWAPMPGLLAKARRVFDLAGRIALPDTCEVETLVMTVPGETGRVLVRLTVQASDLRRARATRMGAVVGAGALIAGTGIAAASGAPEAFTVLAGAGTAALGWMGIRGRYRRTVAGAAEALARFLDLLEHGPA